MNNTPPTVEQKQQQQREEQTTTAAEQPASSQQHQQQQQHQHGEPYDVMCCLATMEDITLEDGNYVEYQVFPSMEWKPCLYERSVVEQMLRDQFSQYVERVKETDCQAELRRLLATGPPVWLHDKHALPLDDNDDKDQKAAAAADEKEQQQQQHVCQLWFAGDNSYRSAQLEGAPVGDARQELWNELNAFLIPPGEGGSDDEDEKDK